MMRVWRFFLERSRSAALFGCVFLILVSGCHAGRKTRAFLPSQLPPHVFLPADPELVFDERVSGKDDDPEITMPPGVRIGSGWGDIESWGMRGLGDHSVLEVTLPDGDQRKLYFRANACPDLVDSGFVQVMTVLVNDRRVGETRLGRHMKNYSFPVPPGLLHRGPNEIRFQYSSHHSPAELGTGTDRRQLAIGLKRLALSRWKPSWRYPVSYDPGQEEWTVEAPGRFVLPLPDDTASLSFMAEFRTADTASPCRIRRLRLPPGGGGLEEVQLTELTPGENREISMSGKRECGLQGIVFDLESRRGRLSLRGLPSGRASSPEPPEIRSARRRPPNIVLIILDAARVDHFGTVYRYGRDTTPAISRFAEKSLVFRKTGSLAPYTICSIPTILTGLSFASHGMVDHGLRLSRDILTLAEALHRKGYQTLAFSGSPNDSIRLGFDQGYEAFFEAWKTPPYRDEPRGFRVSHRVRECLEHELDGRPFHLLIHMVPPHEPYEPLPEYDVFSDPEYAGPANGRISCLSQANEGKLDLDEGDRRQIMALYDGNLRMGDAAVSEILEGLRSTPEWERTVVAITSDHGEAFREHGYFGHNATVYDEMMRVPLILYLPDMLQGSLPALDREASLEDLCPTLLALAGVEADPRSYGRDLLDPERRERWLYQRSAGTELRALRGFGWKLILTKNGRNIEVYDLHDDPKERHDLGIEEPELTALLAMRLLIESRKYEFVAPERQEAPLAPDDEASLKALGYLQ